MKFLPESCLEIENSLPLWVGGDLDPRVRSEIERHLAACEPCSSLARRARASRQALRSHLTASVGRGPDLWPSIQTALRAEGRFGPAEPTLPRMRAGRGIGRFWPVAAAAAALLGFWLGGRFLPLAPPDPLANGTSPVGPAPAGSDDLAGGPSDPGGALPAPPVFKRGIRPAGLRRLARGEAHLADMAEIYGLEPMLLNGLSPVPPQPVSQFH